MSESEIHVWAPLDCSFAILNRFAHDKALQEKLFGKLHRKLVFIDGYEGINPSWEEFEKQFFHFLNEKPGTALDIDEYVGKDPDDLFAIFLVGFDNAIKHGNTDILKHIGSLLEKYSHLSLILLTEQNIVDSDAYTDLIKKHMIVENIHYQPLLSYDDSLFFLQSIADAWQFIYQNGIEKIIAENVGGHTLLLEEAARIVRDAPNIPYQELLQSPTLIRKAKTIFKALNKNDQEKIKMVLENPLNHEHVSEYLSQTGLVVKGKVGFPYWQYMYTSIPEEKDFFGSAHAHIVDFPQMLTYLERKAFDILKEKAGVVSREIIAEAIWGEQYLDKYSDWAIDQLIHRLREKLQLTEAPYRIHTKKGEGFYLKQQDN